MGGGRGVGKYGGEEGDALEVEDLGRLGGRYGELRDGW